MKGKLYGIGVGPGDPELLTLKAISAIRRCDVIAVPGAGEGKSVAFSIVASFLTGQEILACPFVMDRDMAQRQKARQMVADQIIGKLEAGKNVGFVTLGDPATYSTYMYLHPVIVDQGYDTEMIPGVTSYAAAAAALGIALCEGEETLTILPGGHSKNIEELLDDTGNLVIMKSGANIAQVLAELKERGYGARTKIACRVAMDGQRLYANLEAYEKSPETGYFTVAIVKGRVKSHGLD